MSPASYGIALAATLAIPFGSETGHRAPILDAAIGADFADVLAAAQHGDEGAFARLWHDAQPALLRYLRVIAPGAAEDIAAETWAQVVRGLATFRGDERNWRAWLFTTARRRHVDQIRRE